ncbi:uncharacterized protein LOC132746390 [Ruditapes philippinarum]|uniref:uncharacterized protein LOC132746390 n=1 Tax=Ruditapes philippinarum TaxID=129788 RepID=UPI00295B898B|nr:uncharacterized protein LOC132746390 [Ruditapes philippinarum]
MKVLLILCVVVIYTIRVTEGAACTGGFIGAPVRKYDFNYASDTVTGAALSGTEDIHGHEGLEVVLNHAEYTVNCDCGIITTWMFFAWRPGTVVFYVLEGTKVMGTSSFNIGDQSDQNFFEVPLSSDMWIPVKNGYKLGFYTAGNPMITYQTIGGYSGVYRKTGQTLKSVGDDVAGSGSGSPTTDRRYAVAAYIKPAHPPMFVNAPFETTVYTHATGTVIYTASVLDLDGTDTLTYSKKSDTGNFDFDDKLLTLTYASALSESTYLVELAVSDGCNGEVTGTVTINLVNEGPRFTKLPASTTVVDSETASRTLYTFTVTDPSGPSGDSLTCSLYDTNPDGGPFSISQGDPNVYVEYNIVQSASPGYTYSTKKYYDLRISCTDGVTTVYSNFQVDVVKNEAPTFTAGSSGYVPESISVDRSYTTTIYQLAYSDAESDTVSFSRNCDGNSQCPFTISGTGEITTNDVLHEEGYNLDITISDNHGNAETHSLSVVTSGRPYTFNEAPIWRNLPATKYVMEKTPAGTFLFKVIYTDENPTDTFTMAKVSHSSVDIDTHFHFDPTTGIISVKKEPDFEKPFTGGTMSISINDGALTQHETITGTITFVIVNVNEGITLNITHTALSADETNTRGTAFTPNPVISATDEDAGDNMYFTMDCGDDSKYFYLDTATNEVKFAREYDMDSGLSGTATCNVTVRDEAGMSDSGLITLTINNVNDPCSEVSTPYIRFLRIYNNAFFHGKLPDMAATDLDSDAFGSTNGVLTYSFSPASPYGRLFSGSNNDHKSEKETAVKHGHIAI